MLKSQRKDLVTLFAQLILTLQKYYVQKNKKYTNKKYVEKRRRKNVDIKQNES